VTTGPVGVISPESPPPPAPETAEDSTMTVTLVNVTTERLSVGVTEPEAPAPPAPEAAPELTMIDGPGIAPDPPPYPAPLVLSPFDKMNCVENAEVDGIVGAGVAIAPDAP